MKREFVVIRGVFSVQLKNWTVKNWLRKPFVYCSFKVSVRHIAGIFLHHNRSDRKLRMHH